MIPSAPADTHLVSASALRNWGRAGFHTLYAGASRRGKSGAMMLAGRAFLRDPSLAFICLDPEGELARHYLEFCANPRNGAARRPSHYFKPNSLTHTCALSLLHVPEAERTPQACHDVAVRALNIFQQILNFGAGDSYGPRLSKLFLVGCFGLALKGWPLIALPELYTSASHLRAAVGAAFEYEFLRREWEALDTLWDRNPTRFLEYTESVLSRLTPIFSNPMLRRIFGQDVAGVDFGDIIEGREAFLIDLGGMEHIDSVLVGTACLTLIYDAAGKLPIVSAPKAVVQVDEAFDYLIQAVARSLDRLLKRGVSLQLAIQRLAQAIKPDDPANSILSAVLTNCLQKIVFGGLHPDDAELMARLLFTADNPVLLQTWKPESVRPVAVGNDLVVSRSSAEARHQVEQSGIATSETHATARADAVSDATSRSWGMALSAGTSHGSAFLADAGVIAPPTQLTDTTGRTAGSARMSSGAYSQARSAVRQAAHARGTSTSHGTAHGTSSVRGEAQQYVTRYELLPTEFYSLPEMMFRLQGALMNLPPRDCIVKIQGEAAFKTRTPDLAPAFASAITRAVFVPRFTAAVLRDGRYTQPVADIDAAIAARLAELLADPRRSDTDFASPEPRRADRAAATSERLRLVGPGAVPNRKQRKE